MLKILLVYPNQIAHILENKLIRLPANKTIGSAIKEEIKIEIDINLAELNISMPAIVIKEPRVALLAFSNP